jgi:tetraacyldisaccharide 4'-kinase
VEPWGPPLRIAREQPVVALAGIARPDRFFAGLEAEGWRLGARIALADHHVFRARDLARMTDAVRDTGAAAVLTTEKDAVRLLAWRPLPVPVAFVPLRATLDPADVFASWLLARVAEARARRASEGP